MKEFSEKIPDAKEIEKEIGDFLNKKFGGNIKVITPALMPNEESSQKTPPKSKKKKIHFDLKPSDLVAYLDQYIVKQDQAKQVLSTKICTHFNRIKSLQDLGQDKLDMVGKIKSNILMLGPTGVGKTYMVKLIAKKIGVPFVKGDATKFSETGYVGGDVEDLIRDLVREADEDLELAQYGIVYIDEIDKIASTRNLMGADISRTGVQRALLKPMEDTDVEIKVPHDPISMMQEIERYQKTGKREKRVVNTANILFIMSGAFADMAPIIKKRLSSQAIGFGAQPILSEDRFDLLKHMKTEDLVEYGFETEFVGRLPIRTVFERLAEDDLFTILKNPNNPLIQGKKWDFAAYGIDIKFEDALLRQLACIAFNENTGARGLVSAIEDALLLFEHRLPSANINKFPATLDILTAPQKALAYLVEKNNQVEIERTYNQLAVNEKKWILALLSADWKHLSIKHNLTLSKCRSDLVASYYAKHITDLESAIQKIKFYYEEVKKIELYFFNKKDINIIFEEDAIDYIIEQFILKGATSEKIYTQLTESFEDGLKLIMEKSGKNRFFIHRDALIAPDLFLDNLVKDEFQKQLDLKDKD